VSSTNRPPFGYVAGAVCGVLGVIALIVSWTAAGQLRGVAGVASGVLCCAGLGLAGLAYRRQLDNASR
jgi:drug/metabolite transporter (DMT)-like permease